MPAPGKSIQNAAWLIGERVARAGITVTVLGLVARHLGPSQFGSLVFARTLAELAMALAPLGLEGLLVGELVKRPDEAGRTLGTALRLRMVSGFLIYGLLMAGVLLNPSWRNDWQVTALVGLSLLCQPADVIGLWFDRHLQSSRLVNLRLMLVMSSSLLRVGLVLLGAPLICFAIVYSCEFFVFALALGWLLRRADPKPGRLAWDSQIASRLWRRGLPLALAGFVIALSMRLDQFLVQALLPPEQCGSYLAACRLTEMALFTATALSASLLPGLADTQKQGTAAFHARLQEIADCLSALGWITALGFTVAGPLTARLLFGKSFEISPYVLIFQGWGCLFAMSAIIRFQFVLLAASSAANLLCACLGLAVQAALGLTLIPRLGMMGAALAWVLAAGVSGWLSSWLLPSLRPCALAQTRALLIPFSPRRWGPLLTLFSR